ncbi:hypothetical protein Tco_0504904 [Tanacetum coccineum]
MNEETQEAQIARDEEIARQWDEEERKRAMDEAKTAKKIDWNDPSCVYGNYKIGCSMGMSYNEVGQSLKKCEDFNQNIEPSRDAEMGSDLISESPDAKENN